MDAFSSSDEAFAAEALFDAYRSGDPAAVAALVKKNYTLGNLDNQARLVFFIICSLHLGVGFARGRHHTLGYQARLFLASLSVCWVWEWRAERSTCNLDNQARLLFNISSLHFCVGFARETLCTQGTWKTREGSVVLVRLCLGVGIGGREKTHAGAVGVREVPNGDKKMHILQKQRHAVGCIMLYRGTGSGHWFIGFQDRVAAWHCGSGERLCCIATLACD